MPRAAPDAHAIAIHLDKLLADRGMTLTELSKRVGVSVVDLSILKNGHARAIRFSTLTRLCPALDCQPGDLLSYHNAGSQAGQPAPDRLIRRDLIAVAGRTARHGRGHLTLHLPQDWHREHQWLTLHTAACGPPATAA